MEEFEEHERTGRVFQIPATRGQHEYIKLKDTVSKLIRKIGVWADVKVDETFAYNKETGEYEEKISYASANECRKTFGSRWCSRVTAPVLMELMRHSEISTTMKYYVDQKLDDLNRMVSEDGDANTSAQGSEHLSFQKWSAKNRGA